MSIEDFKLNGADMAMYWSVLWRTFMYGIVGAFFGGFCVAFVLILLGTPQSSIDALAQSLGVLFFWIFGGALGIKHGIKAHQVQP